MASPAIVIKVKFGETLRRFSASIHDKKLDLDNLTLRTKIRSLFNFHHDADFTLTYVDEDGDAVTLADDDDLHDVVRQSLNPLRITVTLNSTNSIPSSGTSTPFRSTPQTQLPFTPFPPVISDILKSMPDLREQLTKLPIELASKATSSTPMVSELVEKMTAAYLNSMAAPTAHTPNGGASTGKVDPKAESSNSKNKEKVQKMSEGVTMKPMDLNVPYFDFENGKSSEIPVEKNKDTTEKTKDSGNTSGDTSGWAQGMLNATSQCPFSGIPTTNESYHHHSRGHHHSKRYGHGHGHGNGIGSLVFHRGVRCDGCGVHPITGPRFKSKVKEDYDLCSDCFAGMGNLSDYIRMDKPMNVIRHHMPFRGFHEAALIQPPTLPHALRAPGSRLPRWSKLDSRFILDVNVLDGTIMAPFTAFTKIWRMRNNGNVIWPRGSQLQWIGGDKLSNSVSVGVEIPDDGLAVDKELDVAVDFNAPELPGRYISYWRMSSPSGQKFGQRVWVLIQVDASMKDLGQTSSINLNLPPVKMNNPESTVHDGNNLVKVNDPEDSSANQDLNFPINDTLIVNNGGDSSTPTTFSPPVGPPASSPVFPSAEVEAALSMFPTEAVAYPTVDFPEVAAAVGGAAASPVVVDPSGSGGDEEKEKEKSLLEELGAMGFRQMELNKEILRMNNYDLEKSVDDLCGVSEWDPMLEELQEMGFVDEEANRRLLKKNNGSIKRVVMDLINGERV